MDILDQMNATINGEGTQNDEPMDVSNENDDEDQEEEVQAVRKSKRSKRH